jgi:hypothetical protein
VHEIHCSSAAHSPEHIEVLLNQCAHGDFVFRRDKGSAVAC